MGRNATNLYAIVVLKGGDTINERKKRFAQEYIKTLNATQAYINAGYKTKDRSQARQKACRLKKDREVSEYIAKELERSRKKAEIDSDRVIALLYAIAFTSPADFGEIVEEDGGEQRFKWKNLDELSDDVKRAIAVIKNTKGGIEIETLDRIKAIDLLIKYIGCDKTGGDTVMIAGENEIEE